MAKRFPETTFRCLLGIGCGDDRVPGTAGKGWSKRKALLFNLFSGLAFLVGGVVVWMASEALDVSFLIPFAAGNFIYIGASDLVPEVNKHHDMKTNLVHFLFFVGGLALLWLMRSVVT